MTRFKLLSSSIDFITGYFQRRQMTAAINTFNNGQNTMGF